MSKGQKYQIYLLLMFVMIAWGLNVIATKIIVTTFEPVTITALRVFTAGISVFIILSFLRIVRVPTKKELSYILYGTLFNVVAHHYFLAIGLTKTTASNGGLILGLGPILTTIVAFLFLGNKVTLFRIFGILLGFSGVSFIVLEGGNGISGISIGDLYIFISILAQAISFVMIKKASTTLDPRLMTGYMLVLGSVILFVISLFNEPDGLKEIPSHSSFGVWILFLGSAIIATAIGHMTYNYAMGKVGVAEASIFINLNPFFALVSSVIFLGENITFSQIFGFIFILFGVLFGSGAAEDFLRESKRKVKEPPKIKRTV
jgi:drug/metabolite transporter (DMT)-like permease